MIDPVLSVPFGVSTAAAATRDPLSVSFDLLDMLTMSMSYVCPMCLKCLVPY